MFNPGVFCPANGLSIFISIPLMASISVAYTALVTDSAKEVMLLLWFTLSTLISVTITFAGDVLSILRMRCGKNAKKTCEFSHDMEYRLAVFFPIGIDLLSTIQMFCISKCQQWAQQCQTLLSSSVQAVHVPDYVPPRRRTHES